MTVCKLPTAGTCYLKFGLRWLVLFGHASRVVHSVPGFGRAWSSEDALPVQVRSDSGRCRHSSTKLMEPPWRWWWWGYGDAGHRVWELSPGRQAGYKGKLQPVLVSTSTWGSLWNQTRLVQLAVLFNGESRASGASQQWWAGTGFLLCK